jgi:hypothetical protein
VVVCLPDKAGITHSIYWPVKNHQFFYHFR